MFKTIEPFEIKSSHSMWIIFASLILYFLVIWQLDYSPFYNEDVFIYLNTYARMQEGMIPSVDFYAPLGFLTSPSRLGIK